MSKPSLVKIMLLSCIAIIGMGLLLSLAGANPNIVATKVDTLVVDNDGDGFPDPGDVISYTIVISSTGDMDAENVMFNDTIDANTTLVGGSLSVSPIARDDGYDVLGNVGLNVPVANGLINNNPLVNGDNDPDGGTVTATAVTNASTNQSGQITINDNGSFTYTPPTGFTGTDFYDYEITDNEGDTDTARVTFTVSGMLWFVDASSSVGGDGTLADPFDNLAGAGNSFDALAADDPGDNIFVADGNYTCGLTLLNNQKLIGDGSSGSLATIAGVTVPPFSNALPTFSGTDPVLTSTNADCITLASGNIVRGLNVGNTVGNFGLSDSGGSVGSLTISEVAISGSGGAVEIDNGGTLAVSLDSVASTNSPRSGIDLAGVSGTFIVNGTTTIGNATNVGITLANISGGASSITFGATNVNNRNATGIFIDNVAGTVTFGDTNIPNPNNATGYGVRVEDSSAVITFASTDIDNPDVGTPQTYNVTTGDPLNQGDGDGIFLSNNTGSFTVNGGTFTNLGDNALDFRSTTNITLNGMTIGTAAGNSTVNAGIYGFGGSNLTVNNSTLQFIGNNVTAGVGNEDNGMELRNLAGTLTISNSSFLDSTGYVQANAVTGSENHAVDLVNQGVDLNVNVVGSLFRRWDFEGLSLRHSNGTMTINIGDNTVVNKNTFEKINGAAVDLGPNLAANSNDVNGNLLGNDFTEVGIAANLFGTSGGTATYQVLNNVINDTGSDAFRFPAFNQAGGTPNGTYFATVRGNQINDVALLYQGSGGGSAFFVAIEDGSTAKLLIDQNTGDALNAANAGGNLQSIITTQHQRGGDLDIVFTNNNFSNFSNNFFGALFFQVAGTTGANSQCVRFGNNIFTNHTGLFMNSHGFDLTTSGGNDELIVEGFTGTTTPQMDAYLNSIEATGGNVSSFFGSAPTNGVCNVSPLTMLGQPTQMVAQQAAEPTQLNAVPALATTPPEPIQPIANSNEQAVVKLQAPINPLTLRPRPGEPSPRASLQSRPAGLASPLRSGETVNVTLGTLNPGQEVTIEFRVTIDDPLVPASTSQVCNQATITATGINAVTDDPDTGTVDDPTCTAIPIDPGTIHIQKVTDPSGTTELFTYTHTITTPNSFALTDGVTQTFNSIAPGTYTVTEDDPTLTPGGFDLTGIACDDIDSTGNTGTRTATINLDAGETMTCIFTNTQRGSITIIKSSDPVTSTNFTFSGDLGIFTLDDAGGDDGDAFTDTITFLNASAGLYTVTEAPPGDGYNLNSIECDDGASATPSTGNIGSRSATINLDGGEDVTCTFTNSQSSSAGSSLFYLPVILKSFGFTSPTPKPDLIVTDLSLTPNGDGTHTVQVTGFNQSTVGVTSGNNFFISIYVDPPEPFTAATLPPPGAFPVLNLGVQSAWFGPQQGRTVQGVISIANGPHRVYAWIDPFPLPSPSTINGTVDEQLENNNTRLREITISNAGADVEPLAGPEPPSGIPPTPTPEP